MGIFRDTNLRENAHFEIEVFPNVFWVPANALGKSRLNDADIARLVSLSPEEKRDGVRSLYEAIQLFQASKFTGVIDNVRVLDEDNIVLWVFNKPGYYAVRTNTGCCAADSNWLCYLLRGKYSEVCCLGYLCADGNGHIINSIEHNDSFYFVDMMMQRVDSLPYGGAESGEISDYRSGDASGFVHRAKTMQDYSLYLQETLKSSASGAPFLFYRTIGEAYAIGARNEWRQIGKKWGLVEIENENPALFFKGKVEILRADGDAAYEIVDKIALEPNWSLAPSFDFGQV